LEGKKTTTTRNEAAARSIGLNPGETGIMKLGDRNFNVHYRGMLNVTEAGGQKAILQSEGVNSVNDFKFQQTKDWFNGKGKLAVYDISPIDPINPQIEQKELLETPIKTERQYWPGEEVGENESEFKQALGKAEFKLMMDQLSNYEPEFYDAPLDTKPDNLHEESVTTRLTPENFENFWKLYQKFGDSLLSEYETLEDLIKDLKSITYDKFDLIYPTITKALEAYQNDEISPENLEDVERELSEYGLLRYKNIDEFNPNQLKLFTDEEYEQMLKNCK
jgi:hypothetical protein